MRFLTDVMLGRLTRYLRMMGHDVVYADEIEGGDVDDVVADRAARDDRTLVTRDGALATAVDDAVLLAARDVGDQLLALHEATGVPLRLPDEPRRCSACGDPLDELAADDPRPAHAPDAVDRVWRCRDCGQHYWRGSHWDDVADRLAALRD